MIIKSPCPRCNIKGFESNEGLKLCLYCFGKKYVTFEMPDNYLKIPTEFTFPENNVNMNAITTCPTCAGEGNQPFGTLAEDWTRRNATRINRLCQTCAGKGWVTIPIDFLIMEETMLDKKVIAQETLKMTSEAVETIETGKQWLEKKIAESGLFASTEKKWLVVFPPPWTGNKAYWAYCIKNDRGEWVAVGQVMDPENPAIAESDEEKFN